MIGHWISTKGLTKSNVPLLDDFRNVLLEKKHDKPLDTFTFLYDSIICTYPHYVETRIIIIKQICLIYSYKDEAGTLCLLLDCQYDHNW